MATGARVTIGQLEVSADHAANLVTVGAAFREAARVRADLLVLPEYAAAFDPRGTGAEHAEPLDGPFVGTLRRLAREHGVAVVAGNPVPGSTPGRGGNGGVAGEGGGDLVGKDGKGHRDDGVGQREADRAGGAAGAGGGGREGAGGGGGVCHPRGGRGCCWRGRRTGDGPRGELVRGGRWGGAGGWGVGYRLS